MKIGKRILALALAFCLLCSSTPLSIYAADEGEIVAETPVVEEAVVPEPAVQTPAPQEPDVPEPTTEEAPVEEPVVTEAPAASAQFSVVWNDTPYSGAAVDVSSDVVISCADGTPVKGCAVSCADGVCTVTGLQQGMDYVVSIVPGADKGYFVAGESQQALVADGLGGYVTAAPFGLSYNRYDLLLFANVPEGQSFVPVLSLGGAALPVGAIAQEDGSYRISGLYTVDGDYQLSIPQYPGFFVPGGCLYTVNAASAALSINYSTRVNVAEFDIYWKDNANASGRRTAADMKDMLRVHTVTDGVVSESALEGIEIAGETQEYSELGGFEKVTYTVTGLPELGDGSELELRWVEWPAPLPGYEGACSDTVELVEWFDPLRLRRDAAGLYAAEKAYAFTLPEYDIILRVNGLSEEAIGEFIAGVKVSRYDYNTDAQADFGAFWTERSGSDIRVRGLYQSDAEGYPAFFTVTWPAQVAGFSLPEGAQLSLEAAPAMSTFAAESTGGGTLLAELNYFEKQQTATPSGTAVSRENLVWYDPNNDYSHQGQLQLSVPVTVGGTTVTFSTADGSLFWDEARQAYVHNWTLAEVQALGLTKADGSAYNLAELNLIWAQMAPLTVTDNGENNLNRVLVATTTEKIDLVTTQYYQEVSRESVAISVGEISVLGTTYTPAEGAEIREYKVGTSEYNGESVTTFYSMVDITFDVEFRNGDDPITQDVIDAALESVRLWNMNVRDESGEGTGGVATAEQITSAAFPGDYGFEYDIQSTLSANADGSYTVRLPLFRPNKIQADYAISCDEYYPEGADHYYRVEHDNTLAPGHGTDVERTYADGKLILIRTGATDFNFTKVWADDGSAEAAAQRPKATYTLWRYTTNGGDYTTASMVEIPVTGTLENGVKITSAEYLPGNHGTIPTGSAETDEEVVSIFPIRIPLEAEELKLLDKYDAEGYPYIYFVREDVSGGEGSEVYTKIYGSVSEDGKTITPNPLPEGYDGTVQKANDSSIYDEGVITNLRTDYTTLSVTKSWTAAYYQDHLDTLSVTMQLWAQHADGSGEPYEYGEPIILDGFDAFNPSQSAGMTVNRFDNNGHPLKFWWEEVRVTETRDGVQVKSTDVGHSTENLINEDPTDDPEPSEYQLMLNLDSIAADGSIPNSDENFDAVATVNGNATHFSNTLEGETEYWVKKSWDHSMTKSDVTFVLYAFDKDGGLIDMGLSYTLPADSDKYSLDDGFESVWIEAFENLPLYSATGNRISYIVKEEDVKGDDIFPLATYNKDPDEDGTNEPNSVYIHNAPIGEDEIEVRKIWLDDSATTDRAPVYYNVYTTAGLLLYGTENERSGIISADPVEVDDSFNWMETVAVTFYSKTVTDESSGQTSTEYISGSEYNGLDAEGRADWTRYPYADGYYIREVSMGGNAVSATELTSAGYTTVSYGSTKYAVIYNKDGRQSSEYTNCVDADGFYSVTNLRIGTTNMEVTKIWKDDDTVDRSGFSATMTVTCTDDAARIRTGNGSDTVNGYAKVHTAVDASGWVPLTDRDGAAIPVEQSIGTGDTTYVYYYNLPLYDETGKILHYDIDEFVSRVDGVVNPEGSYVLSSSGLTYRNNTASETIGVMTVTNTFQHTADVSFNLMWLDEYRVHNKQRPDMYLTLYHTVYDAEGNVSIEPYGFEEYVWDSERNQKITEDFWRYTFPNMRQYDDNGNKITYYATVSTHVDSQAIDYLSPQYSKDGFVDSGNHMDYEEFMLPGVNKATVTPSGGFYTVSHSDDGSGVVGFAGDLAVMAEENTFVLQIKDDVLVQGHKIWERVPVGFPTSHLPLLNFMLQRSGTTYEDELDQYLGEDYAIAAILNYESPSTDFLYEMHYVGINRYDSSAPIGARCSLVAADEVIDYTGPDGTEYRGSTALHAWMRHAGLDPANGEHLAIAEKYYGQELPQYNGKGEMYLYTVLESWLRPNKDSYISNRVDLEHSINEYNIVNSIRSDSRPIQITKDFLFNGQSALPEDFLYPALEFTLYRFVKLEAKGEESARYSELTEVDTVTLTGSQVKAIANGDKIFADFGPQEIYAPNGNPFVYVIGEKVIGGYNNEENDEYPLITLSKINDVQAEEGIPGWPELREAEGQWYTDPFTIDLYTVTGLNPVVDPAEAKAAMKNNYTALEQTEIAGSKTWNDFNNYFGTRPEELNLELRRKVTAPGQGENGAAVTIDEKVADIVLRSDGSHSITAVEGINLTSEILGVGFEIAIENVAGKSNVWSYKVTHLDKYATNAVAWVYRVVEKDELEGYKSTGSGMNLTNELYRSFEVFKEWTDGSDEFLNEELEYPDVEVKLQVSEDGSTWQDASTYFGDKLGAYEYSKRLGHPHWRHIYQNLPMGFETDGQYAPFYYRVLETKIFTDKLGEIEVSNDDFGSGQNGSGKFGNGSFEAAVRLVNDKDFIVANRTSDKEFRVVKVWNDFDNGYNLRYLQDGKWTVRFNVYREYKNGEETISEPLLLSDRKTQYVMTVTGTGKTDNSAEAILRNLPSFAPNGSPYTYYAVELNPDGTEISGSRYYGAYDVSSERSQDDNGDVTTVTNTLITTEVAVTKLWEDDAIIKAFRPNSINLTLKRGSSNFDSTYTAVNGAEPVWSKDNANDKWTATYENLPKYNNSGTAYVYTVTESQQTGYRLPLYVYSPADKDYSPADSSWDNVTDATIRNIATRFYMDKVDADDSSTQLNGVELVWRSTAKIGSYYWFLVWGRGEDGVEYYNVYCSSGTALPADARHGERAAAAGEKVAIRGLPDGSYEIIDETRIPLGYWPSALGASRMFTLDSSRNAAGTVVYQAISESSSKFEGSSESAAAGSTALLKVLNHKTELTIEKLGTISGQSSARSLTSGWEFEISGEFYVDGRVVSDTLPYSPNTAEDFFRGKLIVGKTYTMVETENPDGFKLDTTVLSFTIDESGKPIFSGSPSQISVSSAEADNILVYTVRFTDAPFSMAITKNVRETDGSAGAALADARFKLEYKKPGETDWSAVSGKDALKTSSAGLTIHSAEWKNGQVSPVFVTGESADTATHYLITETAAPNGYRLLSPAPHFEFWFDESGTLQPVSRSSDVTAQQQFLDRPIELTLYKYDDGDYLDNPAEKKVLADVSFTIRELDSDRTGTVTTDKDGRIDFGPFGSAKGDDFMLIGGKSYTLTESAKPGYQVLPAITFYVDFDGTVSLTEAPDDATLTGSPDDVGGQVLKLYNDRVLGKVTITKATSIDGKDYELTDVVFHLYMADEPVTWWESLKDLFTGTSYKLVWTSDNRYDSTIEAESTSKGDLVIENLPWGTYKLVEHEGPDGFKWEEKEFEFTIEPQNLQQHVTIHEKSGTIYNNRFSVTVFKHARTTADGVGKGVAGAEFAAEVLNRETQQWEPLNTLQPMVSGENGKLEIHSIAIQNGEPAVIFESGDDAAGAPRYRIREIRQPNGYLPPVEDEAYTVFWFDRDGDVHYLESGSDVRDDNKFLDTPIEIKLTKYDTGDIYDRHEPRETLAGVRFTISEDGASPARTATVTTGSDGSLRFGPDESYYLNVGKTYTLTEQKHAGYVTLPPIQFTVQADGTVQFVGTPGSAAIGSDGREIELSNDRERGSVTLSKYHAGTATDLSGAGFELWQDGEKVSWYSGLFETGRVYTISWAADSSAITGVSRTDAADGKLRIIGLPWGSYELREVKAPAGYRTESIVRSFTIGPKAQNMILEANDLTVENKPFAFSFYKHAKTDKGTAGEALEGAVFQAWYEDEKGEWQPLDTLQTMVSDRDGKVTLQSTVLDKNGQPQILFANGDDEDTAPHYRITETKAPDGYILPANAYMEFWFDRSGAMHRLDENAHGVTAANQFLDEPLKIKLVKYDAGDLYAVKAPLADISFTIQEVESERKAAELRTNRDGVIEFGPDKDFHLIGGKSYTLTETPAAGYVTLPVLTFRVSTDGTIAFEGSKPLNGEITEGGKQLELVNERERGQVTLRKYVGLDGTEYALDGAVFELYHENESVKWWEKLFGTGSTYTLVWDSSKPGASELSKVETKTTGDGTLVITNLPWGSYKLVEVQAPNGYVTDTSIERSFTIDARRIHVDLTLDAKEVGKVENKPFDFTVYKKADADGKAGMALDTAVFEVQYYDAPSGQWMPLDTRQPMSTTGGALTLTSVVLSGSAPLVIFENGGSEATAQHYRIVEKTAPNGYILPGDAGMEFWFDRSGTLQPVSRSGVTAKNEFLDKPIEITLVKYDEGDAYADKALLANVSFTITETDTQRSKTVITDANGTINFGPDSSNDDFMLIGGKTYTLAEAAKPGYVTLPAITFAVSTDGTVSFVGEAPADAIITDGKRIELSNERRRGQVTLTKYADFDGSEFELEGAVFELYHADEPVTWWEKAKEFITGSTYTLVWSADSSELTRTEEEETGGGKLVIKDLPWGTYKLVEVRAADGYKSEKVESDEFTIDPQNLAATVTIDREEVRVENKPFDFSFSKNAELSGGKAGALLDTAAFAAEYRDENGRWMPLDTKQTMTTVGGIVTLRSVVVVDGEPVVIFRTGDDAATAPRYRITETVAPDGYSLPANAPYMEFWFDRSGTLQPIQRSGVTDKNEFLDPGMELKLVKYDEGDAYAVRAPLANVSFTITETDTQRSKVLRTNGDGVIEFGPGKDFHLIGGKTYTLAETPRPGYVALPVITIAVSTDGLLSFVGEVPADAVITDGKRIELTNERKRGQVTLTKYADFEGSEYELEGATFELYHADEPVTWWEKTRQFITGSTYTLIWSADSQTLERTEDVEVGGGQLIIRNLPWGTYKLVEVLAADGYRTERIESSPFTIDPQNLSVSAELDLEEVRVENKPFSFLFSKNEMLRGAYAGALLDTAAFKAEYRDENGLWQPLDTRQTMTTVNGTVTLQSVVVVEDEPVVIFRSGDDADTAPRYRITETVAPNGYVLPDNAPFMEFWFDRSGTLQPIRRSGVTEKNEFLDEPLSIRLVKYDEGDAYAVKAPLANVAFTITETDTQRSKVLRTNADGVIDFGPEEDFTLIGGKTYTLIETPKPGYVTLPAITIAVDTNGTISFVGEADPNAAITENGSQLELINDRKRGQVTLTKLLDGTEAELEGAVFHLYRADEPVDWWGKVKDFITGTTYTLVWSSDSQDLDYTVSTETGSGKLVITDLPWGSYKLVEVQAPSGYVIGEESELEFTIDPQNLAATVEVDYETGTIYNSNFRFEFYKNVMDKDGQPGEPLSGAVFEAWIWDKEAGDWAALDTRQPMVSDNGVISLESVVMADGEARVIFGNGDTADDAPLYRITEKVAPAGYIRPDDIPYMTFWFDREGTLHLEDYSADVTANCEFLDCPIELILVKYDGGDRGTGVKYNFADPASFDPAGYEKLLKLENITFTLSGSDGSQQQTAITNDTGVITMGPEGEADFAVIGGVTYTLTEEDVTGRGYTTILPFTFTVKENGQILLPDGAPANATTDNSANTLRLVNARIPGSVSLYKHTADDTALNGIAFELYRLDTPNSFREKLLAFLTGSTYTLDETFDWKGTTEEDFKYDFEILDDGYLRISGLDWGRYKLVETVADGYVLSRDESERSYFFEIGPDNTEENIRMDQTLDVLNTPNELLVRKVDKDDPDFNPLKGAEYKLYRNTTDKDGNTAQVEISNTTDPLQPMWVWDSESGTGKATRLSTGDYTLVETRSPSGYVIANPIHFHMDAHGGVSSDDAVISVLDEIPLLLAKDSKTVFRFNKAEIYAENCGDEAGALRALAGVTFTAYYDEALTQVIGEAVSDENGVVTFYGLPLKDYKGEGTETPVYIRETATTPRHEPETNTYVVYIDCVMDENGQLIDNSTLQLLGENGPENVDGETVINDVHRADILFTKVSELDKTKAIPCAVYGLYKTVTYSVGSVVVPLETKVAEATADENGKVIFHGLLMDVDYTIRELSVPTGSYLSSSAVTFRFTWTDGQAVLSFSDDGDVLVPDGERLVWLEPQTIVAIRKITSGGKLLKGATLQLLDEGYNVVPVIDPSGKTVTSWVSGEEIYMITGQLEAGKTYYLRELAAPSGFVLAKDVKFTVPNLTVRPGEIKVIDVAMKNYHVSEVPKTGDETPLLLYGGVLGVSSLGLALLLLLGSKRRRKES